MKRVFSHRKESSRLLKRSRPATAENVTIRDVATRFLELAMEYLTRDEPYQDTVKSLLSQFNLWTAVNGVFAKSDASLDSRLARESDHSNSRVIVCNLRIMCNLMASSATWSGPQPLEDIRAVLDSLHSLGASLAAAYPSNRLVCKVAEVFKAPKHTSRLPDLFDRDNVVDEMKQWHLGYDMERMGEIADSVCKEYQVVFAILLLLYRPMKIFDFIKEGLNDTKLPFKTSSSRQSDDASKNLLQAIELTAGETNQFLHYQQIIRSRYPDYFKHNMHLSLQVLEEPVRRTSPFSTQTQYNGLDDAESPPPIKQPSLQLSPYESPPPSPSSTDHQRSDLKRRTILDKISYLDLSVSAGVPVTGNLTHYRLTSQRHEEFLVGNPRPRTPPRLPPGYVGSMENDSWIKFNQESALRIGRWASPPVKSSA